MFRSAARPTVDPRHPAAASKSTGPGAAGRARRSRSAGPSDAGATSSSSTPISRDSTRGSSSAGHYAGDAPALTNEIQIESRSGDVAILRPRPGLEQPYRTRNTKPSSTVAPRIVITSPKARACRVGERLSIRYSCTDASAMSRGRTTRSPTQRKCAHTEAGHEVASVGGRQLRLARGRQGPLRQRGVQDGALPRRAEVAATVQWEGPASGWATDRDWAPGVVNLWPGCTDTFSRAAALPRRSAALPRCSRDRWQSCRCCCCS
jgi:hypothetical protein